MNKFENPQMEINKFDETDVVVTASGPQTLNVRGLNIGDVDAESEFNLYN